MTQGIGKDIIDCLIGRGNSAPDAFVQGKWALWMRLRPRAATTRRDALIQILAERPLRPVSVAPAVWPHWLALLCWQMGPEPAPDQRRLRQLALLVSVGMHVVFALLLAWVALVRSAPAPMQTEPRVALRFVSAGQGSVDGATAASGQAATAAAPTMAPRSAAAASERPASQAEPDAASAPVQSLPPPAPLVQPATAAAAPAPTMAADEVPPAEIVPPAPVADAAVQIVSTQTPVSEQVPAPALLVPAPPVRDLPPRAMDFALEADVLLPVRERELELRQTITPRPLRPLSTPIAPALPSALTVPERSIELAQRPPATPRRPVLEDAGLQPSPPQADIAVREREVAVRMAAPALHGVAAMQVVGPALGTPPLTVAERSLVSAAAAPAVLGRGATAPAIEIPDVQMPTVAIRERHIELAQTAAPVSGARQAGASADLPAGAATALPAGPGQPVVAPAAPGQLAAGSGAAEPASPATRPMAGSGQDWARGAAGSDDWSRPGQASGMADGLASAGATAGLRAADLPAQRSERGAPGGENDQWTRQRLEAGGTWLRRPPPGHAAGRFDRYWVPNESLLAEWVRKGIKNVDIPLPGGGGSISCVISLLQLGGGCGVTDPNRQEQPAQARAAPQIPYKPALQNENGSP